MLLKQPRLSGVLPLCGRLHVDFRDLNLDEIANGDETYQPVPLHHGHMAEPVRRISAISRLIVSASPAVTTALVAVVVHFANVDLPISPSQGSMILLLGYLVLAAGNVVRGL